MTVNDIARKYTQLNQIQRDKIFHRKRPGKFHREKKKHHNTIFLFFYHRPQGTENEINTPQKVFKRPDESKTPGSKSESMSSKMSGSACDCVLEIATYEAAV